MGDAADDMTNMMELSEVVMWHKRIQKPVVVQGMDLMYGKPNPHLKYLNECSKKELVSYLETCEEDTLASIVEGLVTGDLF